MRRHPRYVDEPASRIAREVAHRVGIDSTFGQILSMFHNYAEPIGKREKCYLIGGVVSARRDDHIARLEIE